MFERFTGNARQAVQVAQQEALGMSHRTLGTEHLLLGVLGAPDGLGGLALRRLGLDAAAVRRLIVQIVGPDPGLDADALRSIGIDLTAVRRKAEESFGPGALDRSAACRRGWRPGYMPLSPRAKKVLELSLREARHDKSTAIGSEHLLLAILREGKGLAAVLLARSGVERAAVETAIDGLRRDGGQAGTA